MIWLICTLIKWVQFRVQTLENVFNVGIEIPALAFFTFKRVLFLSFSIMLKIRIKVVVYVQLLFLILPT
jgi:hypothetical protein